MFFCCGGRQLKTMEDFNEAKRDFDDASKLDTSFTSRKIRPGTAQISGTRDSAESAEDHYRTGHSSTSAPFSFASAEGKLYDAPSSDIEQGATSRPRAAPKADGQLENRENEHHKQNLGTESDRGFSSNILAGYPTGPSLQHRLQVPVSGLQSHAAGRSPVRDKTAEPEASSVSTHPDFSEQAHDDVKYTRHDSNLYRRDGFIDDDRMSQRPVWLDAPARENDDTRSQRPAWMDICSEPKSPRARLACGTSWRPPPGSNGEAYGLGPLECRDLTKRRSPEDGEDALNVGRRALEEGSDEGSQTDHGTDKSATEGLSPVEGSSPRGGGARKTTRNREKASNNDEWRTAWWSNSDASDNCPWTERGNSRRPAWIKHNLDPQQRTPSNDGLKRFNWGDGKPSVRPTWMGNNEDPSIADDNQSFFLENEAAAEKHGVALENSPSETMGGQSSSEDAVRPLSELGDSSRSPRNPPEVQITSRSARSSSRDSRGSKNSPCPRDKDATHKPAQTMFKDTKGGDGCVIKSPSAAGGERDGAITLLRQPTRQATAETPADPDLTPPESSSPHVPSRVTSAGKSEQENTPLSPISALQDAEKRHLNKDGGTPSTGLVDRRSPVPAGSVNAAPARMSPRATRNQEPAFSSSSTASRGSSRRSRATEPSPMSSRSSISARPGKVTSFAFPLSPADIASAPPTSATQPIVITTVKTVHEPSKTDKTQGSPRTRRIATPRNRSSSSVSAKGAAIAEESNRCNSFERSPNGAHSSGAVCKVPNDAESAAGCKGSGRKSGIRKGAKDHAPVSPLSAPKSLPKDENGLVCDFSGDRREARRRKLQLQNENLNPDVPSSTGPPSSAFDMTQGSTKSLGQILSSAEENEDEREVIVGRRVQTDKITKGPGSGGAHKEVTVTTVPAPALLYTSPGGRESPSHRKRPRPFDENGEVHLGALSSGTSAIIGGMDSLSIASKPREVTAAASTTNDARAPVRRGKGGDAVAKEESQVVAGSNGGRLAGDTGAGKAQGERQVSSAVRSRSQAAAASTESVSSASTVSSDGSRGTRKKPSKSASPSGNKPSKASSRKTIRSQSADQAVQPDRPTENEHPGADAQSSHIICMPSVTTLTTPMPPLTSAPSQPNEDGRARQGRAKRNQPFGTPHQRKNRTGAPTVRSRLEPLPEEVGPSSPSKKAPRRVRHGPGVAAPGKPGWFLTQPDDWEPLRPWVQPSEPALADRARDTEVNSPSLRSRPRASPAQKAGLTKPSTSMEEGILRATGGKPAGEDRVGSPLLEVAAADDSADSKRHKEKVDQQNMYDVFKQHIRGQEENARRRDPHGWPYVVPRTPSVDDGSMISSRSFHPMWSPDHWNPAPNPWCAPGSVDGSSDYSGMTAPTPASSSSLSIHSPSDRGASFPPTLSHHEKEAVERLRIKREDIHTGYNRLKGSSSVYRAELKGEIRAVKKIPINGIRKEWLSDVVGIFDSELLHLSKLRSPNIVQVYGASVSPADICVVYEFVDGGTLRDLLENPVHRRRLGPRERLSIAQDVAAGMKSLYAHGLQHRQLTSSKILLTAEWQAKIVGVGLLMTTERVDYCNGNEEAVAAIDKDLLWAAREVLAGAGFSEKSDVYSFGIVLWEIFQRDGSLPYTGLTPSEVKSAKYTCRGPPMTPNCPPVLINLMKECWSHLPVNRPTFDTICKTLDPVNGLDSAELRAMIQSDASDDSMLWPNRGTA